MHTLRVAVIGGGAVAERVHLPALARSTTATAVALVERSWERGRALATTFGIPRVVQDYREALDGVDAAIVGLPHHLHAPVTIDLLHAGIHVLVEKPMALNVADCERMADAADRSGTVLAVGLLRRCAPALRWVAQALHSGMCGRVETFDLREGSIYGWPVASGSMFRPEGGGGVLADAGAHVLDLVAWWFGDWRSLRYRDDAAGGVEADCLIELEMQDGARGRIELSRTRTLRNSCVITTERGTIEVGTKTDALLAVRFADGLSVSGKPANDGQPPPTSLVDLFTPQLEAFAAATRGAGRPVVSGRDAIPSIELLRACYAQREPWMHPWDIAPAPAAATDLLEVAQ